MGEYVYGKPVTAALVARLPQSDPFFFSVKDSQIHEAEAIALAHNTALTRFRAMRVLIGKESVIALCTSPSINHIDLTKMNGTMRSEVASAIARNTVLTSLELSDKYIDATTAKILSNSTSITHLTVSHISRSSEPAHVLFQSKTLRHLCLCKCKVSGSTGPLEHNTTLTELRIYRCDLGPLDVGPIARNTTLTCLSVCGNNVRDEGAVLLASNTTIETLSIDTNGVGDVGALALALNTAITRLNVSRNPITTAGFEGLATNTTIFALDATSYNGLGSRSITALSNNTGITHLGLAGSGFSQFEPLLNNESILSVYYWGWSTHLEEQLERNRAKTKRFPLFFTVLAHVFSNRRFAKRSQIS